MTTKIKQQLEPHKTRESYRLMFVAFALTNPDYEGLDRKKLTDLYLDYVKKMIDEVYDL